MSNILTILNKILSAQYGKDVRQAIHDGIETCYNEGKAGSTDLTARADVKQLNTTLKNNFNQNRIELTNSSYYPAAVCYRSGQTVYMKCSGVTTKEVPADSPYVIGLENMMPDAFKPNADITAYPEISLAGKRIKLEILSTGRVIFTSPEKLPEGFGINMHFTYMTGKSNF